MKMPRHSLLLNTPNVATFYGIISFLDRSCSTTVLKGVQFESFLVLGCGSTNEAGFAPN
jgi:hypothetical protein